MYRISQNSFERFQWRWQIDFGQISKFKKRHSSQKKIWIRISCGCAYLHIMSFINTKFQEILLSGFRGVALKTVLSRLSIFHFGQISKFKKSVNLRKKKNKNFLWICASTHYVLHNYKAVERFQRSCADKNIIPSATRCVGYYYLKPP